MISAAKTDPSGLEGEDIPVTAPGCPQGYIRVYNQGDARGCVNPGFLNPIPNNAPLYPNWRTTPVWWPRSTPSPMPPAKTRPTPQRVTVDKSCSGVAAAYDPRVQAGALNALNAAKTSEYEQAFFASENIFSDGYSTGPIFSSNQRNEVSGERIVRAQPGLIDSLMNGTYRPSLLVHTHQTFAPPRPVSRPDQNAADNLGFPIAAIDRSGRLTCTRR